MTTRNIGEIDAYKRFGMQISSIFGTFLRVHFFKNVLISAVRAPKSGTNVQQLGYRAHGPFLNHCIVSGLPRHSRKVRKTQRNTLKFQKRFSAFRCAVPACRSPRVTPPKSSSMCYIVLQYLTKLLTQCNHSIHVRLLFE